VTWSPCCAGPRSGCASSHVRAGKVCIPVGRNSSTDRRCSPPAGATRSTEQTSGSSPGDEIAPYNESLHDVNDAGREAWARKVWRQLKPRIEANADVIFLAGAAYRSHLEPMLLRHGHRTSAPMSFLGIGSQVAWLQKVVRNEARLRDIDRFYALLQRLAAAQGGPCSSLASHTAKTVKPERGIYFFFEAGERRMTSPFVERVVRIGTHSVSAGSKATLWGRLRTHRGGANGTGNHRGSIFRLHVGECLIQKAGLDAIFPQWGVGQSASTEVRAGEEEIEFEVSRLIGEMGVLWLEVPDDASADSDRAYLERNLIALLAGPGGPVDLPSSEWLGRWSSRDAVRTSGLWNVNHVHESYDPHAVELMEEYVEIAEGARLSDGQSRARQGWRSQRSQVIEQSQIDLI
jgi:hypothetical protein